MLVRLILLHMVALALAASLFAQVASIDIEGRRYLAQPAVAGALQLDADACFFNGQGLLCSGDGPSVDDPLNKGKSFTTIKGLTSANEVCWYVHIPIAGKYSVTLRPTGSTGLAPGLELRLDQQRIAIESGQATIPFEQPGVHCVRIANVHGKPRSINGLIIKGESLTDAAVLRTRWRPAAAHVRFSSSTLQEGPLVWIMEMDAAPGQASFYSPMTTPFGYFGPSWTAEGKPKGLNFSMWSYGRGKEEPPVAQLSHLLAVGSVNARFDGFGHEGTGVKPRGWNPFENWQGERCVLALRKDPGKPYDTYTGYVFDEKEHAWKLYAAGRKYVVAKKVKRRARKEKALWVGSFVEVPGPPQRQRTGHIVREMRYRGFVLDSARMPHRLDRMSGLRKKPVGNQGRGLTEDGRFRMWIGGMEQSEESRAVALEAKHETDALEWLKPAALAALFSWPTTVTIQSVQLVEGSYRVRCQAQGLGELTRARFYCGSKDALTLADRWDNALEVIGLIDGDQTIDVPLPKNVAEADFARILVENSHGKFWSTETVSIGK